MGGQRPVEMVGAHGFQQSSQLTFWCGVLADCGTVWRHGCRHRASTDGFTACPASGEGTAHSTNQACDCKQSRTHKKAPQCGAFSYRTGPCGGVDAATEPPWTDSRRVPRAVRAPRTRPTRLVTASNRAPTKKPRNAGLFLIENADRNQRFIELKNSSLDLVVFILSSRNSIAAISSIGCSSLRRIQIFCSSSGSINRSSRRVPERLMSIAG
ncbi:hypothetical protein CFBP7900_39220 [Xanthomonas hortorum pv. carotae]|uniref:Uncharacterized protein n=1 Tax=Xanthomonas hortorum pv. carotae TaxID=487904 RepID=A0A6V7FIV2_9XANT|nr:hypothetical protein CFBP7900_39220 [Xanthomonas hortorum pv. carotae]CAD0363279.1 hypothetical protein CFBP7900_39220 [Xanthomonas hortorum pv. carotae]